MMRGPKTRVKPISNSKEADSIEFDYKNYEELGVFMSERAKVYARKRTGLSAKQQRQLATAVKRARHLALLPYKQGLA